MRHFDEQLQEVMRKLVLMGSLSESMVHDAVRALIDRNPDLMDDVHTREHDVNCLQVEIDEAAVTLTATHQPVAADVRFLFMASRISNELERIGDQGINIVQNTEHVLGGPPLKPLVNISIMGGIAERMVRDSLDALTRRDVSLAEGVFEAEKKVDALRDQIFRTLLTYMMADPTTIQRGLSLILIARNLERVGDHATNIAEEVIYLVQGKDVRHARDRMPQTGLAKADGKKAGAARLE